MSTLVMAGKLAGTAAVVAGAFLTGHAVSSAPVAGSAFASTASSATTSASTSGTTSATTAVTTSGCAAPGKPDKKLRAARKAALAEPKGKQRRAAVKQVAKDARAGKYGATAKSTALAAQERRSALRKAAPDSFKAALKKARAEPKGQRRDAVEQVRQDAAKGTYGDTFAKAITQAKDHREACRAERKEALQARRTARCEARADGKSTHKKSAHKSSAQKDSAQAKSSVATPTT